MKRVVFSLFLFFLLFTLSTAFRVTKLDLTHATKLSDHDDHIESTVVPDHTRSKETEIISKEYIDHLKRMNRVPVQTGSGLKQYYFLKNRFNPHPCHHHRHRNPVRFVGVNEVGFATVHERGDDEEVVFPGEAKVLRHRHVARSFPKVIKMGDPHYMIPQYRLHHRHRHHHHDLNVEEDAQGVEVKEAVNEEEHKGREKHIWKKIGKFLGYF